MSQTAPMPAMTPEQFQARLGQYLALRDKIKKIADAQKAELKPYAEMKEKLENLFLGHLDASGSDSLNVRGIGTVYRTTKKNATVSDGAEFKRYVIGEAAYDLVDMRANVTGITEYLEKNGHLPPGINYNTYATVGVRTDKG